LNKQGRRSGSGNPFAQEAVRSIRRHHDIPTCPRRPARDPREGPFTAEEAAAQLGVAMSSVHRWLRDGVLVGKRQCWGIDLSSADCSPQAELFDQMSKRPIKEA
jgi:hypothetical protein